MWIPQFGPVHRVIAQLLSLIIVSIGLTACVDEPLNLGGRYTGDLYPAEGGIVIVNGPSSQSGGTNMLLGGKRKKAADDVDATIAIIRGAWDDASGGAIAEITLIGGANGENNRYELRDNINYVDMDDPARTRGDGVLLLSVDAAGMRDLPARLISKVGSLNISSFTSVGNAIVRLQFSFDGTFANADDPSDPKGYKLSGEFDAKR